MQEGTGEDGDKGEEQAGEGRGGAELRTEGKMPAQEAGGGDACVKMAKSESVRWIGGLKSCGREGAWALRDAGNEADAGASCTLSLQYHL